jgi:methionyl-tRNA formyltransferase
VKIVFFGTSDFAVPILEALRRETSFQVSLAVTQPDKPAGRKQVLTASPVKRAALTLGIELFQPETLKDVATSARLKKEKADAFVVVAYGKILPAAVLEIPRLGCLNVHGSLLPKYRGASPISAAIAAGEMETGVTIMRMDEKMDTGPILKESRLEVREDDTTATLAKRLADTAAEDMVPTLKLYAEGHLKPRPQDDAAATYTKILTKEDGRVDWKKSAEEIERFFRAMKPWPEAFSKWTRKSQELKLTFKALEVLHPNVGCAENAAPGQVFKLNDGSLALNCGKGSIKILKLQLEGKPETDAGSFLNGYADIIGTVLS